MDERQRVGIAPDLVRTEIDECFLVLNPANDAVISLNETASDVLFLCDGTLTAGQVVDAMAIHYGQGRDAVVGPVLVVLDELVDLGIVTAEPAPAT